jgi:hypothetical protein
MIQRHLDDTGEEHTRRNDLYMGIRLYFLSKECFLEKLMCQLRRERPCGKMALHYSCLLTFSPRVIKSTLNKLASNGWEELMKFHFHY